MKKFEPIIGLEVHIELSTKSKMFCGCPADHFGKKANTQVCPVCLGLPGALPFANAQAIKDTIKFGSALGCDISEFSKFDRKHYFYPDLPKGYQISQYDLPLCKAGAWKSKTGKEIKITRIHLEEDTGKLIHQGSDSQIDFNRSGVPLVELVTEPDFRDSVLIDEFLKDIQQVVRYLNISTGDMEKGSMRLEANISLSADGKLPDYKVELKNINSFRFLRKAIDWEIKRQEELLLDGKKISQETRGWNEAKGETVSQRTKEEANDYRYFPEPDIPPITISAQEISKIKKQIPELPWEKRERYAKEYALNADAVAVLTDNTNLSEYFERAVEVAKSKEISAAEIARVIVNQKLNEKYPEPSGLVAELYKISKREFASHEDIKKACSEVLAENKKAVEDFQNGKVEVLGFLIGQTQKILKGTGEPKSVKEILLKEIENGS